MIEVASPQAMFELGRKIGGQLRAGDLVLLNGPLGAGKTLLTQGIGDFLEIPDVTSPTFVISRTYSSTPTLIHVDAYRLLDSANPRLDLNDLDLESEMEGAITVVEWGGEIAAQLSDQRLEIYIDRSSDLRKVSAVGIGPRWIEFTL